MRLKKYVGDRPFYRRILRVMLPIVAQQGITSFVSLLDNIMVGRVGTEQMSGVAISNQLLFIFQLALFGGLSGAGIFCAQYYGKGDMEKVRSVIRFKAVSVLLITAAAMAVYLAWGPRLISLFLTDTGDPAGIAATLAYGTRYMRIMLIGQVPLALAMIYATTMRETGETVIPMGAGITAVIVNMVFNYLLIFGRLGLPRMGVAGAAVATVLSRFVELALLLFFSVRRRERFPCFDGVWRTLRVPGALALEIVKKGTPLLFNELLFSVGMTVIVQCYSTCGLAAVAAYNITSTVSNFFFLASFAMGNAIAIVVGQELGAGELEKARDTAGKMIALGVVLCAAVSVLLALFSPLFPRIYNTTDEVRQLARRLLLTDAVFLTLRGFYTCTYFTLRSGGKSVITFLFDSGFMWVVCIPLAFCLSRLTDLPMLPMYAAVQAVDVLRVIVGAVLVRKGVWINNLTEA